MVWDFSLVNFLSIFDEVFENAGEGTVTELELEKFYSASLFFYYWRNKCTKIKIKKIRQQPHNYDGCENQQLSYHWRRNKELWADPKSPCIKICHCFSSVWQLYLSNWECHLSNLFWFDLTQSMTSASFPVIKGFVKNNQPHLHNIPVPWGGDTNWNQ